MQCRDTFLSLPLLSMLLPDRAEIFFESDGMKGHGKLRFLSGCAE